MTTYHFDARRLAIAAACGAIGGVIAYLDAQLVGPEEIREVANIVPATSFWLLFFGGALLGVSLWLIAGGLGALSRLWRPARDLRHGPACDARYDRRKRCSCDQDARNWSPAKRREAFRSLDGGRRG